MKKRALLFCGILCVLYFILCNVLDKNYPKLSSQQGIWSHNIIKAQHFLYNPVKQKYNCLLGTSLTATLVEDSLPENLIVIGLQGQGVLDGLNLVTLKSSLPDTLFIEINVLQREPNKSVTDYLGSTKAELSIKEKLIFLQERYVPLGLAVTCVENEVRSILKKDKEEDAGIINQSILETQLGFLTKDFARSLNKSEKEVVLDVIKMLKSLEEKSVKIVFFEMPVHCSLENMELPKSIRNVINASFPIDKYRYIKNKGCENYQTTDGLHLSRSSAKKYSGYLRDQILSY